MSSSNKGLLDQVVNSGLAGKLGVPQGEPLRRYKKGEPALDGPVVIGGEGRLAAGIKPLLADDYQFVDAGTDAKRAALVFDATGITKPEELHQLFDFFNPQMRKLLPCARLVVIGTTPELVKDRDEHIVQRSLEGFTRSVAKELRRGATAQLVYTAPEASSDLSGLESTLRFLLSGKSAFVDGQVIRVTADASTAPESWDAPLAGKIAVVTGAARGIGADIAKVLGRDGAKVICVDIPAAGEGLAETANEVKGSSLPLDVTAADAAERIKTHAEERHGGKVDIIVHNAGVTRDKLLANMDEGRWNMVQNINLVAPVRITEGLLANGGFADGGRVVGVSSMAGISGNRGQTNYATTKAGVVGMVDSLSEELADKGLTVNAVPPRFIPT
ncbi:MAG: 3-oxoacyl-ACP reductase, partial [Corynebacterium sp.]|nr:3-oxoacyl-ACP reductase [Corynebacterium sp.]